MVHQLYSTFFCVWAVLTTHRLGYPRHSPTLRFFHTPGTHRPIGSGSAKQLSISGGLSLGSSASLAASQGKLMNITQKQIDAKGFGVFQPIGKNWKNHFGVTIIDIVDWCNMHWSVWTNHDWSRSGRWVEKTTPSHSPGDTKSEE